MSIAHSQSSTFSTHFAAARPTEPMVARVQSGEVLLPEAALFLDGEFAREGHDLLISGPQGATVRVVDYFQQQPLPILSAANGSFLLPETVSLLLPAARGGLLVAGPVPEGSVPVAEGKAASAIGKVKSLNGAVTARSQGGESRTLKEGDELFEGEELRTAEGGQVQLLFVDGTLFQLSTNARVLLNKFLYNPAAAQGEFGATVMKGAFAYSSGNLAKQHAGRHTVIKTPTAQIGVRGSALQGNVAEDGKTDLLHQGGVIDVSDKNGQGTVTLLEPGTATVVSLDGGPAPVFVAPQSFLDRFKAMLPATLPGHSPESSTPQGSEISHDTATVHALLESYKDTSLNSSMIKGTLGLNLETMNQAERQEFVHDLRQLAEQLPPLPAPKLNTSHGVFLDSAVAGIQYRTASFAGVTDANGGFSFKEGETVTFSLGGVVIGSVNMRNSSSGLPIVTPTLLAEAAVSSEESRYNVATNIIRLLQTLDSDGDAANGITITIADDAFKAAVGADRLDFTRSSSAFEQQVEGNAALVALLQASTAAGDGQMVSEEDAWQHYNQTLSVLESLSQVSVETTSFAFAVQGDAFTLSLAGLFTGAAGSSLNYSVSMSKGEESPAWLQFDPQTLRLNGTPGNIDVGLVVVKATASIEGSNASAGAVNILLMVNNINDAPVAADLDEQVVTVGQGWQWQADPFRDADLGLTVKGEAIDHLTYSASMADDSPLPSTILFDAASRTFRSERLDQAGEYRLRLTASDDYGSRTSSDFRLTVNTPPQALLAENNHYLLAEQIFTQNEAKAFTLPESAFHDADGWDNSLALSFTATPVDSTAPAPDWLRFNPLTRQFYGTPGNEDGDLLIEVTARDRVGASASGAFLLQVQHTNHAPESAGLADYYLLDGQAMNLDLANRFRDLDQDALTFSLQVDGQSLPGWLQFVDGNLFTDAAVAGSYQIEVTASDNKSQNSQVSASFTLFVGSTPVVHPELLAGQQTVAQDSPFTLALPSGLFTDADAGSNGWDLLTATSNTLPAWLQFDAGSRTFAGTPTNNDIIDQFPVTVTVTDKAGGTASVDFFLSVHNLNEAPQIQTADHTLAEQTATHGKIFQYQLPISDPDRLWGDTLTFTAQLAGGGVLPAWLSFDSSKGIFSGVAGRSDLGSLTIAVTATDQGGNGSNPLAVSGQFTLQVQAANAAPLLLAAVADQSAMQEQLFSWQLPGNSFRATNGSNPLSYAALLLNNGSEQALSSSGGSFWLHFDPLTRTFSGTPRNSDVENWSIKIVATDTVSGLATADLLQIQVNNQNDAPTVVGEGLISRLASPLAAGETASAPTFLITRQELLADFRDPDANDSLSYQVTLQDGSALPGWLHLGTANDHPEAFLYGTPDAADSGTLIGLKIIATDTGGLRAEDRFLLLVTPPNHAPVVAAPLSGKGALQGALWLFEVPVATFSDVDLPNDRLTYQAYRLDNLGNRLALPSWLSFDADTHTFQGTPGNGQVGSLQLQVMATDWYGASVAANPFTLTIGNVNDAPLVLQKLAAQSGLIGYAFGGFSVAGAFGDPDLLYGDTLTYSFSALGSALPSWLKMTQGGLFYAENHPLLLEADRGNYTIKVTASDALGAKVSDLFTLALQSPNQPPQLTDGKAIALQLGGRGAVQDRSFVFTLDAATFQDSDSGDALTWSAQLADGSALPAWLRFDPLSHTFIGTPRNSDVARSGTTLNVVVTATDRQGAFVEDGFALSVQNLNDAPIRVAGKTVGNQYATLGQNFALTIADDTFFDPDGDPLSWQATLLDGSALPAWLSFDASSHRFSGTAPDEFSLSAPRTVAVKVTVADRAASDAERLSAYDLFTLTLNHAPTGPGTITLPAHAVQDKGFYYKLPLDTFQDADSSHGDLLNLAVTLEDGTDLSSAGSWLHFDAASRTLTGLPGNAATGSWNLIFWATDQAGDTVKATATLVVENVNDAPLVAKAIGEQTVEINQTIALSLDKPFSDADAGDQLSYSISVNGGDGGGLSVATDSSGQLILQGAALSEAGDRVVKLSASDGSASVSQIFVLHALLPNHAPTVDLAAIGDQQVRQNQLFVYQMPQNAFVDSDGDPLQLTVSRSDGSALPSWLRFDADTRTLLGRLGNSDWQGLNQTADHSAATLDLKVSASDPRGASASDRFTLTIQNVNDAPTINPASPFNTQLVTQGTPFKLALPGDHFVDADALFGDSLTWNASLSGGGALPSWLTFDAQSRQLSGTPLGSEINLRLTVSDSQQATIADNLTLRILPPNNAPEVVSHLANQQVNEDRPCSFQIPLATFQDADAEDSLTFSASLLDGTDLAAANSSFWLHFDPLTRTFYGTPVNGLQNGQLRDDSGTLTIKVTATDQGNGNPEVKAQVTDTFELTVNPLNDAPILRHALAAQGGESGQALVATRGSAFHLQLAADTFIDPDRGDTLSLRAENLPEWLHFDAETATFTGTPGSSDKTVNIKLIATDSQNASRSDLFTLQVVDANQAPVINDLPAEQSATQGSFFRYQLAADLFIDPEGQPLRYTIQQADGSAWPLDSWLRFDADTRTFSGQPGNADVGEVTIKLLASDPLGASVATLLHLTVNNHNDAPLLVGDLDNQGVVRGSQFTYQVAADTFRDPDSPYGDSLTWSASLLDGSSLPAWLHFDASTHSFSGTASAGDSAVFVKVTATDQHGASASDSFHLSVADSLSGLFLDSKVVNISYVTKNAQGTVTHSGVTDSNGAFLYDAATDVVSFAIGGISLGSATAGSVITPVNLVGSNNLNAITNQLRLLQTLDSDANPENGISLSNAVLSASLGKSLDFNLGGVLFGKAASSYLSNINVSNPLVSAERAWQHFLGTLSGLGSNGSGIFATSQDPAHSYDPLKPLIMQNALLSYQAIPALFGVSGTVREWNVTRLDGSALPKNFWLSIDKDTGLFTGTPGNDDVGTLSLLVSAKAGRTVSSEVIEFTVLNRNDAPLFKAGSLSNQSIVQNKSFFYQLPADAFGDIDQKHGDRLTYAVSRADGSSALPEWLRFDAETGTFSGTPTTTGTTLLRVTASDTAGASVSGLVELKVNSQNHAPILNNPFSNQTIPLAREGTPFRFQWDAATFADQDGGDRLSYSYAASMAGSNAAASLAWLHFDADTRTFSGTPTASAVGSLTIKITASDLAGEKVSDSFILDVQRTPRAPTVQHAIAEQLAESSFLLGKATRFTLDKATFVADPGDRLTLSAALADGSSLSGVGLLFDAATATFSGTPSRSGLLHVRVTATDIDNNLATSEYFDLNVAVPNHAPKVNNTVAWNAPTLSEGTAFTYKLPVGHFHDADNDALSFTLSTLKGESLPGWLTFDAVSNTLYGTPLAGSAGTLAIKVSAADSAGERVADSFVLQIAAVNHAPQLNPLGLSSQVAAINSLFTFRLPDNAFSDPDAGDSLSYQVAIVKQGSTESVNWLHFDADTRTFSGSPASSDSGSYLVSVTAQDQGHLS
ncbi:MAG: putative Ig domain-containing protein, partial [Magnetococcales bacterium]|nr:putative Ig domain-containing protein [Magnetococcales bacterium]